MEWSRAPVFQVPEPVPDHFVHRLMAYRTALADEKSQEPEED